MVGTNKHRDDNKNVAWNDAVEINFKSKFTAVEINFKSKFTAVEINFKSKFSALKKF